MALKEEFRTQGNFLFKYRSYIPITIALLGFVVYYLKELNGANLPFLSKNIYELICVIVSLLGFLVRFIAVGYSGNKTSGRNTKEGQVAESINSTGIYSLVRHPLYFGNFLIWFGIAAFTLNLWFLVAFVFMYWVYYERIMFAEEEFMREKFGDQYTNWANTVPAFIPALRKIKKPDYKFQWKKVIRQEKSGLLNLFIIIFLFDVVSQFATSKTFSISNDYRFYAFVVVLVYYIVVKIIQKSSKKA